MKRILPLFFLLQSLPAQENMEAQAPEAAPAAIEESPLTEPPAATPSDPSNATGASPDSQTQMPEMAEESAPAAMEATEETPAEGTAAQEASSLAAASSEEEEYEVKLERGFKYRTGEIILGDGLASLKLPPTLRYLDSGDTATLLVDLWANPTGDNTLGAILPADISPNDPKCWAVILTYEEDGYVSDKDADQIDYEDLLKDMQKATKTESAQRAEEGYPVMELIGWAAPPRYDGNAHLLYWAKELKFEGADENTLNYNLRLLGRRGVLNLNVVAGMKQLPAIETALPELLQIASFTEGNRYADYDPATDKMSEYGLAALVAGGLWAAGKGGLFKVLIAGILAFKKVILIGLIALAGGALKFFKKSKPAT